MDDLARRLQASLNDGSAAAAAANEAPGRPEKGAPPVWAEPPSSGTSSGANSSVSSSAEGGAVGGRSELGATTTEGGAPSGVIGDDGDEDFVTGGFDFAGIASGGRPPPRQRPERLRSGLRF